MTITSWRLAAKRSAVLDYMPAYCPRMAAPLTEMVSSVPLAQNSANLSWMTFAWLHASAVRTAILAAHAYFLGCLPFIVQPSHALNPEIRLTQYLHTSWRIQDGSAPASIFTVTQTSDGFIWLSAFSPTIYKFDGVRFLALDVPTRGGSVNKIFKVVGDRARGLWAIGHRGIVYLKDGVVQSQVPLDGLSAFQIATESPDGSLWIARAASTVSNAPLCRVTERATKCFGKDDGVSIVPIDSILADGKGGFWLGGQTALAHWHDGVSETYPIEGLKSNVGQHGIVSLALGADGIPWVGILAQGPGLGLGQLKEGVVKPFVTPTFDGSEVEVLATIIDRDGNLWVATRGKGLYRIRGDSVDHYGRTDGLSSDNVNLLFEDREGIVWAGTTNGMDSFRDARVTTFSASEGLSNDTAVGVLASRDDSIWVATDGSLDHIIKGHVSSIRAGNGLPGHQVTSLLEDRAGNLWVGVDDSLYVMKDERFRRIQGLNGQRLGFVVGMAEDIDGNVWAASAGNPRRLVRIHDFAIREEFTTSQIPPARTLAPDPQGGIWIGTTTGELVRLRNGAIEKFSLNPKGDPVSHRIAASVDGSVLAASEDGLVGLRQGKVQRMTTDNGLPCNGVISFMEDRDKRLWLYAYCGVVELAGSELERWWADPKAVMRPRVYDVFDGARPSQPYFNSAAYSGDGRVWFANGTTVQMVEPSRMSRAALPAETYIESIAVDRRQFAATANLALAPRPRDLQIDYTSPTFTASQKVKFRYRLDPYDADWHEAGTRRQAFYTDLPPGLYTFHVMAANGDGVSNQNATGLDFSIAPAYFQTTWFRLLCAALLVALLWTAYRLRVRQLAVQFNMKLDARVDERTRIARELHDTMLQDFQGVLLHFQAALRFLSGQPDKAREVLASAIAQAAEAIKAGRQAVQGLRASAQESNDLAAAIGRLGVDFAAGQAGTPAPAVRVQVEGPALDLHPLIRDEVFRVAGEALRNALQHSHGTQVEVELWYDPRRFRLRVRDDGQGIDQELLAAGGREGHFGLRGMRERALLIGGKLSVWSSPGVGAEVELIIPGSKAYAPTRHAPRLGAS